MDEYKKVYEQLLNEETTWGIEKGRPPAKVRVTHWVGEHGETEFQVNAEYRGMVITFSGEIPTENRFAGKDMDYMDKYEWLVAEILNGLARNGDI